MPTFTAGQKVRASDLNSVPFGHAGITSGFVTNSGANGIYPTLVAQILKSGMTFSSNGLVVPEAGLYEINVKGYFSGGSAYMAQVAATINGTALPPGTTQAFGAVLTWKGDTNDFAAFGSGRRQLNAGDVVRLWTKGGASTWGSTGWDGTYLEVQFVCP